MRLIQTMLFASLLAFSDPGLRAEETEASNDALTSNLIIYSEENPPFNFRHGQVTSGLYVDLLLAMFKELGIKKTAADIIVVPWARAYNEVQSRKNTMLLTVVRTPDRENLFKWVGPIGQYRAVLFARKDRNVDVLTNGFKGYRFGVTQKSKAEHFLIWNGALPGNLIFMNSPESAAQMLARGRIDAWARDYTVASWTLQEQGYPLTDFEVVHTFEMVGRYLAFNKDTDNALIERLQQQLGVFAADGTLAAITKRRPQRPVTTSADAAPK